MTQPRAEETRTHILDAAQECIAEHGYDATGVAEICQRAGLSKGAFYHHFPTKQALFMALLERWLAGLDAELAAARGGALTSPEAFLSMAGVASQVFAAAAGQFRIFLEFWTQAARDPAVWQATIAPYRRYSQMFRGLIEAGVAEGTLRPVDPEAAARALLSLAVGLVLQSVLDPQATDWGQVAEGSLRLFLEGLAAPAAGGDAPPRRRER